MTKIMNRTLLQAMFVTLLLSCNALAAPINIQVISIENAKALDISSPIESESCQRWKISPHDVEKFFSSSLSFNETHYNIFDTYPCSISGKVQLDKKIWDFNINASGWSELHSDNRVKYLFGCIESDSECLQYLNQLKALEK